MSRRRGDYDESDARVRPGRGSRPRTKDRPSHRDARWGMVVTKDRGRWGVVLDDGPEVTCMRAREMGRTSIVVGDRVGVVGDVSGRPGTLARIVRLAGRASVLRRTADDADPYERIVVANADRLLIVCAVADPPPRTGFVERALVAAYAGGLSPVLALTKSDLADPAAFAAEFADLGVPVLRCGVADPIEPVRALIGGGVTALIGHSGVGKSTLVNRLVPEAGRATADVSGVGKGRHTSTQSVALRLPGAAGGWIIDTPGIRSFGLAHITPDTVIGAFPDLAAAVAGCPRGCTHLGPPADPECALDALAGTAHRRAMAVRELIAAVSANEEWEIGIERD
ncbi:ribosome small subunit-dependent GTPase A [Corynebacterium sphenisci]|uniref:ribosome small subunit-dependent GTPase A n=1 Tax=Corynebacterium sphenisci TaxID=191493 RepID=UPI0026DED8CE|nr:ribosome small subunit-dependent GTPase A [Corynebacterium sphenisci]MDO5730625.1 ribosome small subunit-dependent GTPase A [Corynebacterium sphenisci]